MRILHVGPTIGTGPTQRVKIDVQTDEGEKVTVRLFHDWASKQTPETLLKALQGVVRVGPNTRLREMQGARS